jgi:hypothetical protein
MRAHPQVPAAREECRFRCSVRRTLLADSPRLRHAPIIHQSEWLATDVMHLLTLDDVRIDRHLSKACDGRLVRDGVLRIARLALGKWAT